jgi:transposase
MNRTTYGLDLAKNVMQLHWVDAQTGEIGRRKLPRAKLAEFFAPLQPMRIAMEACGSVHHWTRVLGSLGHQVELLPPRQVKACKHRQLGTSMPYDARPPQPLVGGISAS